jgi:hypothetical protein
MYLPPTIAKFRSACFLSGDPRRLQVADPINSLPWMKLAIACVQNSKLDHAVWYSRMQRELKHPAALLQLKEKLLQVSFQPFFNQCLTPLQTTCQLYSMYDYTSLAITHGLSDTIRTNLNVQRSFAFVGGMLHTHYAWLIEYSTPLLSYHAQEMSDRYDAMLTFARRCRNVKKLI